ncbi:MAG: hypothetical protein JWQ56_1448 [Pseudarthrobacter sp.]|nr:hypothetical protein [Pseudarthrobacter sp.]
MISVLRPNRSASSRIRAYNPGLPPLRILAVLPGPKDLNLAGLQVRNNFASPQKIKIGRICIPSYWMQ